MGVVAAAAARTRNMARCCSRATSRLAGLNRISAASSPSSSLLLCCLCVLVVSAAEAGLYTASDQIILLTPENVDAVLVNSTAAIVVEFYASWCGHCIGFSPLYKSLARDIKGWCALQHIQCKYAQIKLCSVLNVLLLFPKTFCTTDLFLS